MFAIHTVQRKLEINMHQCNTGRPRVMYMTCKEEQIRVTGTSSYGYTLVISNTVRHNYKLNHNALKHTKLIVILSI